MTRSLKWPGRVLLRPRARHRRFSSFPFPLQDVQLKVKAYILGTDMSNFKYDDFIVVLDVISRYMAGGGGALSCRALLACGPGWFGGFYISKESRPR